MLELKIKKNNKKIIMIYFQLKNTFKKKFIIPNTQANYGGGSEQNFLLSYTNKKNKKNRRGLISMPVVILMDFLTLWSNYAFGNFQFFLTSN
jgi:hypothetical protein